MRPDLEGLEITKGELKKLTGIEIINDLNSNALDDLLVSLSLVLPVTIILFLGFNFLNFRFTLEFYLLVLIIFTIASLYIWVALFIEKRKVKNNNHLMKLISEIKQYNILIRNIDVLDQLEAAGNSVSIGEREQVIESLKITRSNIERALKTERILRENPGFRPDQFAIDLTSLRGIQITEQATEYGRILNEALEIGISVEEEMVKLQRRGDKY
ncbi:MAG: hypothetical protein DSM107014_03445 [Gomphosphaeria aponina SAG 52.96 = DSM 107014]|uniref:Uncharacterized protein n=1 Tax=Gomphosphaeria aponina SAG 52.96 = DSM 107014 TaxID=1521640 RepID=A0A941GU05_9CHRO|nr:hypothetical protein [Gomphosphaeria aponina SAG 52.96 = DSM 107014]